MLGITNHRPPMPQKGNSADCSRPREACYKSNMRRWTRDRSRRRKPQEAEKPAQENPAPLQPKFPEPASYGATEDQQPVFEAQPDEAELQESQPAEAAAGQGQATTATARSQSPPWTSWARQPPASCAGRQHFPGPGGPTGEAAEAEVPPESAEPVAPPAHVCQAAEGRRGAVDWASGIG